MTPLDKLQVITLFVDDLPAASRFYDAVFQAPAVYQDDVSRVLQFQNLLINLLDASQAPELMHPLAPGLAGARPRALLTIEVENVDQICAKLVECGVQLINGPMDRPWGRRTASFLDPAGHAWEIAHDL